ncbi:hypothetical protein [Catenulispora subtropica]|uniref:Uncharacterized protein n=1 Tax=Catenulispora subtropica TaxID=450798 RepID=A0ABN2RAJ3_9ACTN
MSEILNEPASDNRSVIEEFLRSRGSADMAHPGTEDLRAFLDVTAANELDVFEHDEDLATRSGPGLYRLLEPVHALLSTAGWEAVRRELGARTAGS